MPDHEKVIKGLECCADLRGKCPECPYNMKDIDGCYCTTFLSKDALELLKAQEPRVLTLEEVEDALDTVMWVDQPHVTNSASEFALLESYSRKYEKMDLYFINGEITTWCYSDYGKTWRCWSSRPTDGQREVIPWVE